MIIIIPTIRATVALNLGPPGIFIHLEKFGFIKEAIPNMNVINPQISKMIFARIIFNRSI